MVLRFQLQLGEVLPFFKACWVPDSPGCHLHAIQLFQSLSLLNEECQRDEVTWPRSPKWQVVETAQHPRSVVACLFLSSRVAFWLQGCGTDPATLVTALCGHWCRKRWGPGAIVLSFSLPVLHCPSPTSVSLCKEWYFLGYITWQVLSM